MATKKTKKDEQLKAAVENGSESRQPETQEQKAPKSGIVTTEGNLVDKIHIFQKDGATMVQVDYGKYNAEGKTSEERRAGMRRQISRPLTPEQSKEYQRLSAEDPAKAKEFAARAAYPMHVDDAAFHQKDAIVNGRNVNYIIVEKLDAEKLSEGNKSLAGKWQISCGEKGNEESRFYGIMNSEEIASIRHRAVVTLDKDGQVKSVGAPLTMADIAARVESRINARREANAAKVESAQKVDWSKFKFPEGTPPVTALRYAPSKDPERVWLNGKVNGIAVLALLSKNETTAVKNKMATLEQVGAANKEFRQKVASVPALNQEQGITKDAAVKIVVDRASDPAARSFTAEQVKGLNDFAAGAEDPEAREQIFEDLWKTAEPSLKDKGVNEAWQKDAHDELKDLAQGVQRSEQQSMHR